MELAQKKTYRRLIGCFLMFLILRVVEELYIIPRYLDTKGAVSCICGIIILLFYIRFVNKPLEDIGLIFSKRKIRKGIVLAFILNAVAAVLTFGGEYLLYSRRNGFTNLSIYYESTNRAYSKAGLRGFLIGVAICLGLAILHSIFYELTFRGLLITLGSRALPFRSINEIQAGLYAFWYVITIGRLVIYHRGLYDARRLITLFVFTVLYEVVVAVKLGMLRGATGSVWVCVFDHIAFAFILDMVHMQYSTVYGYVQTDMSYYGRLMAYQCISLLITYFYYQRKTKKIQDVRQKIQLQNQKG